MKQRTNRTTEWVLLISFVIIAGVSCTLKQEEAAKVIIGLAALIAIGVILFTAYVILFDPMSDKFCKSVEDNIDDAISLTEDQDY